MSSVAELDTIYTCPRCGAGQSISRLIELDYRCPACELETAHLDRAPNGSVRSVYQWLQNAGNVINNRYRIVGLLGRGGFAATYLVHDLRLDGKPWALKEVPEPLFDVYETNLLSRLDHPGIPAITDQFQEGELIYLVIKFGGNRTLESERKAQGGRIPVAVMIPWMQQLCEVLHYLHSQTPPIIHRDLKPGNILLDNNNRIMLIDFGIAKQVDGGQQTRTLARAVTPGFSPPEQIGGTGTDPRSDIYSLAASFYALVTGITPPDVYQRFSGAPVIEPMNLINDCSAHLNAAIMQALDLNLNNRQTTIRDFARSFCADLEPSTRVRKNSATVFVSADDLNVVARKTPTAPRDSIPLPSIRSRTGTRKTTPEPAKRSYNKLPLSLIIVAIASIAALGYWVSSGKDSVEPKPALTSNPTEKPVSDQQIPTPAVESTSEGADHANPPVPGQPIQPIQPVQPVQPLKQVQSIPSSTMTETKRTEGPSPMEIFEQRRVMLLEKQKQQEAKSESTTKVPGVEPANRERVKIVSLAPRPEPPTKVRERKKEPVKVVSSAPIKTPRKPISRQTPKLLPRTGSNPKPKNDDWKIEWR
ncbi:MAG: protein kinase domain-containing protein [Methylococcales bacterium]